MASRHKETPSIEAQTEQYIVAAKAVGPYVQAVLDSEDQFDKADKGKKQAYNNYHTFFRSEVMPKAGSYTLGRDAIGAGTRAYLLEVMPPVTGDETATKAVAEKRERWAKKLLSALHDRTTDIREAERKAKAEKEGKPYLTPEQRKAAAGPGDVFHVNLKSATAPQILTNVDRVISAGLAKVEDRTDRFTAILSQVFSLLDTATAMLSEVNPPSVTAEQADALSGYASKVRKAATKQAKVKPEPEPAAVAS